jgi:hypothetical protein
VRASLSEDRQSRKILNEGISQLIEVRGSYAMIYNILYYAPLWYVMLVLIEPHTGYDAGMPCDRVPQCDFWDSTGYTFQVGEEGQQG